MAQDAPAFPQKGVGASARPEVVKPSPCRARDPMHAAGADGHALTVVGVSLSLLGGEGVLSVRVFVG